MFLKEALLRIFCVVQQKSGAERETKCPVSFTNFFRLPFSTEWILHSW